MLKKKHYLEGLLDQTDTQMDNLAQMVLILSWLLLLYNLSQVENIEFTQVEMKVVEGLKQGNECLEQMHKVVFYLFNADGWLLMILQIMSLEDVERLMADTQDAIEYQRVCVELKINIFNVPIISYQWLLHLKCTVNLSCQIEIFRAIHFREFPVTYLKFLMCVMYCVS